MISTKCMYRLCTVLQWVFVFWHSTCDNNDKDRIQVSIEEPPAKKMYAS